MFDALDISTSGLVSHRAWMDTISNNIANMHTTRDAAGRPNPYQRKFPVFTVGGTAAGEGVRVAGMHTDPTQGRMILAPEHPDAIRTGPLAGYVKMPNVNLETEMANAVVAMRSYEANITAMQVTRQMYLSNLRILA